MGTTKDQRGLALDDPAQEPEPQPQEAPSAAEPEPEAEPVEERPPAPTIEVVTPGAGGELVRQPPPGALQPAELTAARLAAAEQGAAMFERYTELLERIYYAALRRTRPQDWVLSRVEGDDGDVVTAMFCATGYPAIAEVYGIGPLTNEAGQPIPMFGPINDRGEWVPKKVPGKAANVYGYEGWARGYCRFNGREEMVIATRWNHEEFAGRTIDEDGAIVTRGEVALDSDLKSALLSLLKKKLVASLAGIKNVPGNDLETAWSGTSKQLGHCRKGHGFGTSADRKSRRTADANIAVERKLLRDELVSVTGGDHSAGQDLLREITTWVDKKTKEKRWWKSIDQMTKGWQFERAWQRLREHPTFGAGVATPAEVEKKRAELSGGGGGDNGNGEEG